MIMNDEVVRCISLLNESCSTHPSPKWQKLKFVDEDLILIRYVDGCQKENSDVRS